MERDFKKKVGRYIKKDAALIKSVSLREFNFGEICTVNLVTADNARANLIFKKYHHPDEIVEKITEHKGLTSDMREGTSVVPILQPLDFTHDWARQMERASKRSSMKSDDEEFEFELEMNQISEELERKQTGTADQNPPETSKKEDEVSPEPEKGDSEEVNTQDQITNSIPESAVEQIASVGAQLPQTPASDQLKPKSENRFQTQKINLDEVGAAINTLVDSDETPLDSANLTVSSDDAEFEKQDQDPNTDEEKNPSNQDSHASTEEDFIPVKTDGPSLSSPEKDAAQEYIEMQEDPTVAPSNLKKQVEEATAKGYEDGFKHGEEKASLQVQQTASKVIENAQNIAIELSRLKKTVLDNVQENFYELSQAIAESLIGHELKINPQSFANVIRKAIQEAVPDDEFKIAIHSDFFDELKKLDIEDISSKLEKNDSVPVGEFRIESKMTVVEGQVKKLIADLLSQANVELFKDEEEDVS